MENEEKKIAETTDDETENIRAILAANIIAYRQKLKLSRAELAAKVGVTEAAIGQYERGTRTPPVDIICKLANIFNTPVDLLLAHGNGEYDSVREYRFDKAIQIMRKLGYSVIETESGNIKISVKYKPFLRFAEGTATIEYKSDAKNKEIIRFKNRQSFVYFFENLFESFMLANGARAIIADVIDNLNSTGEMALPEIEVTINLSYGM